MVVASEAEQGGQPPPEVARSRVGDGDVWMTEEVWAWLVVLIPDEEQTVILWRKR